MYAIASILDAFTSETTRNLWTSLEIKCGLVGIQMVPLPHFSWQVAEEYQKDRVLAILEDYARQMQPFVVKSSGLGIFTGPEPVLYLSLVKQRNLLDIHEQLWNQVRNHSSGISPYYGIDDWVPHITLAYNDATPQNLACAVADLSKTSLAVEILVNNFALIYKIGDKTGVEKKFIFGNRSQS